MGSAWAKGQFLASVALLAASLLLNGLLVARAAVNSQDVAKHQAIRDALFRNLKTSTTQYSFDYVVINLAPGTVPGVDVAIPVSHIRYKSTVFFAFNSFVLDPSADAAMSDLARTIQNDKSFQSLLVVGHTDAVGTDEYNSTLSLNRATAVATRLRELGVNDRLLGVVPMGEAQPVTTNRTSEGRARNRRVEFFISDFPQATRKAIELVKFNPCHRNDQDVPLGQDNPACNSADARIPLYPGSSGKGIPETLILSRPPIVTSSVPVSRPALPNEVFVRPSLKELEFSQ